MKKYTNKITLHPRYLIYAQLILCCFEYFNNLSLSTRFNDVITILIFILCIIKGKKSKTYPNLFFIISFLYLLVTLIGYIFNSYSLVAYLWSTREIITSLVFMWGCITFLKGKDIAKLIKIFSIIFLFNFFVILYQYFLLDLKGDSASGIFGSTIGNNRFLIIFLSLATIFTLAMYANNKIKFIYGILCISICLIISVISELKIYFLLLIFIIALLSILMKPNRKTIIISIGSLVLIYFFIQLLYKLYPSFSDFFSIEKILSYSGNSGYTGQGDVNRLSGLITIADYINYKTSIFLFGIGIGNAEFIKIFKTEIVSEFYSRYNNFLHYTWFTQTLIFLETGIVGFSLYIARYIALFIEYRSLYNSNKNLQVYCIIGKTTAVMAVFQIFYSNVMQSEIGIYLFYLIFSMPFALQKDYLIEKRISNNQK